MRLLLDEMLSAAIAEQLRVRGRDVVAVSEQPELRGLSDLDIFAHAQRDERATVTYNYDDFLALDRQYRAAGRDHFGIVVVRPRRFAQGAGTVGTLVASFDALVEAGAPYRSFVSWLR